MASNYHDDDQYYWRIVWRLIFIWRLGGKFTSTLINLDTSINQLNNHLIRVDAQADSNASVVQNHEIRLVIIERELNIEVVSQLEKEKG